MVDLFRLMDQALEMGTSDIHLGVGEPPTFRVHGRLVRMEEYPKLKPEDTEGFLKMIATERSQKEVAERMGADFGYAYGEKARFRVAVFKQRHTISINMRIIPFRKFSFDELGLPPSIVRILHLPRGLILVTGPTGSGKTTTLATFIDYINKNRDCHIVTIEDPIEYYHTPDKSIISQREVYTDVPSFEEGVVKALRQDPDVILVGEMRDLNTIAAAITAAEMGHLVLSTLHTTGADRTVDRITDVFPHEQQEQIRTQLSGNLVAVISQLLLPTVSGRGRVAAFEIMICTPAIAHLIRDKKTHSIFSAIQTGQQLGMRTLDTSLLELYLRGAISKEEALRVAVHPDEVQEKIREAEAAGAGPGRPGAPGQPPGARPGTPPLGQAGGPPPRPGAPGQPGGQPPRPGAPGQPPRR
ncbi:MAG: type IV pilus twitching motility protein PilT [Armatimonadota bacterium]|nr:type IV pilus twitching motility protein PilT [Armatimonadota bacterium]